MVPVLTSSCETLGQSLTHLGASLSAKAEWTAQAAWAAVSTSQSSVKFYCILLCLRTLELDPQMRPQKHLLHRGLSHQVMK